MNINDQVKVVSTARGAEIYNEWYSQFKYYKPETKYVGDEIKESLWHIMQVFGPGICMGCQVPFINCEMEVL